MTIQLPKQDTQADSRWRLLCDTPVRISCQAPVQVEPLTQLLERIFAFDRPRELPLAPGVFLNFKKPGTGCETNEDREEVFASRDLRLFKTCRGFFIQIGASFLDLDLLVHTGTGVLVDDFWCLPYVYQREFFLFALVLLMRPLSLYALHANGISKNEVGYLVIGDSGCGKTTLSLNLVLQGWNYLSDDVLMLRRDGVMKVESLALRQGFACPEDSFARFDDFKIIKDAIYTRSDSKRMIDNKNLFPDQFIARFFPAVLLFPEIASQPETHLVPMSPTGALLAMIRQSSGLLIDAAGARKQMDVLKHLANQACSYQVRLGTDVYEHPSRVANLIWEARPGAQVI